MKTTRSRRRSSSCRTERSGKRLTEWPILVGSGPRRLEPQTAPKGTARTASRRCRRQQIWVVDRHLAVGPITCKNTSTGLASGRPVPPVPVTGAEERATTGLSVTRVYRQERRPESGLIQGQAPRHINLCPALNLARAEASRATCSTHVLALPRSLNVL